MNDQPNPWEDSWRDELASYEASVLPGDWSAMDSLLDGGSEAPPEPSLPGPSASGAWIKGVLFGISLAVIAGLSYLLMAGSGSPAQDLAVSVVLVDTLPPGARYDIKTYNRRNQAGEVIGTVYDTTIIPAQYLKDTIYLSDDKGNLTQRIDSTLVQDITNPFNLASSTSPAPATAPAKNVRDKSRNAVVSPLMIRLDSGFPDSGELLRQRLLRIVAERPLETTPSLLNNGYYPPIKDQY